MYLQPSPCCNTAISPGHAVPARSAGLGHPHRCLERCRQPDRQLDDLHARQRPGRVHPHRDGVAGNFSGTVSAVSSGTGFGANASAAVRINSTGQTIDDTVTVGGVAIPVVFKPGEEGSPTAPFLAVVGSGSLALGTPPFVEVEGSVSFATTGPTSPTSPITVFVGQGPAFNDDGTANATARGAYLVVSSYQATSDGSGHHAFTASGNLSLVGIPGVNLSATGITVSFNDYPTGAGNTFFGVAPGTRSLSGTMTLSLPNGVSFTGSMGLSYSAGTLTITLGSDAIPTGSTPVTFTLGDTPAGGSAPLTGSISSGTITAAAGDITATNLTAGRAAQRPRVQLDAERLGLV